MDLKPGSRWASQVCSTEVVVVRTSTQAGLARVRRASDERPWARTARLTSPWTRRSPTAPSSASGSPTPTAGSSCLVTKAGEGSLAVDGISIPLKEAKPLPSSD